MMDQEYCLYCMNPVAPGKSCPICGLTAGSYKPLPHHLPPGTVLQHRYLLGRVLGEGGFGITYIGCDLQLEMKVAIKEYFPTDRVTRHSADGLSVSDYTSNTAIGQYETGKKRFLDEARMMAKMIKQPEIVSVQDYFQCNNTAYIIMEYVEGTTFKELVAQHGGRISAKELFPIMEPLFHALAAMHDMGLIHRDISPDNLMLENGKIRLLDFGCAREPANGDKTITVALKHGYAPPEQYDSDGWEQGAWTDIYALSATIYYCLTGKRPPNAMDRVMGARLMPPRALGADLTENQEQALLKGMALKSNQRFRNVEAFRSELYESGTTVNVSGTISEPPGDWKKYLLMGMMGALAALLLTLTVLVVLLLMKLPADRADQAEKSISTSIAESTMASIFPSTPIMETGVVGGVEDETVPTTVTEATTVAVSGQYGKQMTRSRNCSFPYLCYDTMPEKENDDLTLGYTYPFEFNTPLRKCVGFTLEYEIIEVIEGSLTGNFRYSIMVHTLDGQWKSAGSFRMDGYEATIDVQLEERMGIDAVAVTCGRTEDVSYSFDLKITNPQVG